MSIQLYWGDIKVGDSIPPLVKKPTTRDLVKWAGATGDFHEIHYDKDYALHNKLPGVIVHGALKSAWFGQMLGDWVGGKGRIKKYTSVYCGMDFPGDILTCTGIVTKTYTEGTEHVVEADIWLENGKGEKTTSGIAIVVFPSKV